MFVTSDKPFSVPSPNVTLLSNTHCWLSQTLPLSIRCSGTGFWCSRPSLPLLLSLSICLSFSLSHKYLFFLGCLTPHTHFASLVSRTQATRTVMSSMRSWIQRLWPPLPAREALLTLAQGILSSMQPSSLAHTSACHYRPFPSDFGLKVHRPMHSFPRLTPPPPPFLVCLPLESFCFLHSHWI